MTGVAYIPSRLKYPIPPNEDTVPLLKYAKVPVSTLEELPLIYPDPLPYTYMFVEEISMLAFYDSELLEWRPMQDTTVSDWARKGVQPADVLTAIGAQPKLISGQNIKTINGESLLASGDIVVTGDGGNAATVNGFTVEANVPADAKFTDTIYSHPATHPASMIVEDSTRRFVTDAEKAVWNDKVDNSRVLTDVPANAKFTDTIYLHPTTHPASMIVQDATRRFVTDAEKAVWNTVSTHNHDDLYEPKFSKNTAFNKNFGTSSGTVARGNDSRINNGQTAYDWGNHASAGYASASALNSHISAYNNHVNSNLHLTQAQRDVLAKLSIVNGNLRVSTNIISSGEVTAYG
jgi:hypothetical protein